MGIPLGNVFRSDISSSIRKDARCENCGCSYFYELFRKGSGSGFSLLFLENKGASERAAETAKQDLAAKLAREVDPVPCPKCGNYQAEMIAALRRKHRLWMYYTGILIAVLSFLPLPAVLLYFGTGEEGGLPAGVYALFLGVAAGMIVIGVRRVFANHLDPNMLPSDARSRFAAARGFVAGQEEEFARACQNAVQARQRRSQLDDESNGIWAVVGLLFFGVGVYMGISMWPEISDGAGSNSWPTVPGVVLTSSIGAKYEKKECQLIPIYFPVVEYQYAVEGEAYTSSRFQFQPETTKQRDELVPLMEQLAPGKPVHVFYKPADPSTAVLLPGIDSIRYFIYGGLIILGLAGLAFGVYSLRRWWKNCQAGPFSSPLLGSSE